jgi:hypothetical protein
MARIKMKVNALSEIGFVRQKSSERNAEPHERLILIPMVFIINTLGFVRQIRRSPVCEARTPHPKSD